MIKLPLYRLGLRGEKGKDLEQSRRDHVLKEGMVSKILQNLLKPGGMLCLTVPAYNFLWSHEDVDAGHFRRYTLGALEKKLCEVGLETVFGTFIFGFLPLPVFFLGVCLIDWDLLGKVVQARRSKEIIPKNKACWVR